MTEMKTYFSRPLTRREAIREIAGSAALGIGGIVSASALIELDEQNERSLYQRIPTNPQRRKQLTGVLLLAGAGVAIRGLSEAMKVESEVRNTTFKEFIDLVKEKEVSEVSIAALREGEVATDPSPSSTFGLGPVTYRIGEAYFSVYEACLPDGKKMQFKQQNDVVLGRKDSPANPIAELKNALTVREQAEVLKYYIPGVEITIIESSGVNAFADEALRTGLSPYPLGMD